MDDISHVDEEMLNAREDIKDRIEDDIEEVVFRHGRKTTEKALTKVAQDFRLRRFVNPYPIPHDVYEALRKETKDNRINVGDMPKERVAQLFIEKFDAMEPRDKNEFIDSYHQEGEEVLFAWIDLLLTNLFIEERDEYVEHVCDQLKSVIDE